MNASKGSPCFICTMSSFICMKHYGTRQSLKKSKNHWMAFLQSRLIFFHFSLCFPRAYPSGRLIFAFLFSQMDSTSASAPEQIDRVTAAAKNRKKRWNNNRKRCLFIKQRQGERWLYKYELLSMEGRAEVKRSPTERTWGWESSNSPTLMPDRWLEASKELELPLLLSVALAGEFSTH